VAQHLEVQRCVAVELGGCRHVGGVEGGQRPGEARGVAGDERFPELGLAGDVVVQGRLGDLQLGSDVGVAEAVEPAGLYQPLGSIKDPAEVPELP